MESQLARTGEVDSSGTWTDGFVVGSTEWNEAHLAQGLVGLLLEQGAPGEDLMGVFDEPHND